MNNENPPKKRRSPVRRVVDISSISEQRSTSDISKPKETSLTQEQINELSKLLTADIKDISGTAEQNIKSEISPKTVSTPTTPVSDNAAKQQPSQTNTPKTIEIPETLSAVKTSGNKAAAAETPQVSFSIELNAAQKRVISPIPKSVDISSSKPQANNTANTQLNTQPNTRSAKPAASVRPNVVKNANLSSANLYEKRQINTAANRSTANGTAPVLMTQVSNVGISNTNTLSQQKIQPQNPAQNANRQQNQSLQVRNQQRNYDNQPAVRGIEYEYINTPPISRPTHNTDKKSKNTKNNKKSSSGGTISSIIKALIYITFIFVVSGTLSYFAITIGNDVFAFVKSDAQYEVSIPDSATIDDIKDVLYSNGIIKYPEIFKIYSIIRKDDGAFVEGTYTVSPSLDYDDLLSAFKDKTTTQLRTEVSITIPEGYTVDEIIDLFVSRGMSSREEFVDVIQNYDFDFWFVKELTDLPESRTYRLEGYLFPDTYYFYSDSSAATIIYKLLSNFDTKFPESYKERCDALGMTVDQVITLASMIQMEAKYADEYGKISSVFHNRLNNPSVTNGKLESDATIQYALSERKSELTLNDLNYDSPYNSYLYDGLPPGPISNPSLNAISYAMYPDDTDYYFFVATSTGRSLFAATSEEHNQNKVTARGGN